MTNKAGQTQSLNVTSEELKAISFALQWSYMSVAMYSITEREWKQNRKITNSLLAKVKDLLSEGNYEDK